MPNGPDLRLALHLTQGPQPWDAVEMLVDLWRTYRSPAIGETCERVTQALVLHDTTIDVLHFNSDVEEVLLIAALRSAPSPSRNDFRPVGNWLEGLRRWPPDPRIGRLCARVVTNDWCRLGDIELAAAMLPLHADPASADLLRAFESRVPAIHADMLRKCIQAIPFQATTSTASSGSLALLAQIEDGIARNAPVVEKQFDHRLAILTRQQSVAKAQRKIARNRRHRDLVALVKRHVRGNTISSEEAEVAGILFGTIKMSSKYSNDPPEQDVSFEFSRVSGSQIQKLIDAGFLDRASSFNESPPLGDVVELLERFPQLRADGWIQPNLRTGIVTALEAASDISDELRDAFRACCASADELIVNRRRVFCWWD